MTLLEFFEWCGIPTGLGLLIVFLLVIVIVFCASAASKAKKAAKTEKVVSTPISGGQAVSPAPVRASGITAAIVAAVNQYQKDNSN